MQLVEASSDHSIGEDSYYLLQELKEPVIPYPARTYRGIYTDQVSQPFLPRERNGTYSDILLAQPIS